MSPRSMFKTNILGSQQARYAFYSMILTSAIVSVLFFRMYGLEAALINFIFGALWATLMGFHINCLVKGKCVYWAWLHVLIPLINVTVVVWMALGGRRGAHLLTPMLRHKLQKTGFINHNGGPVGNGGSIVGPAPMPA